MLTNLRLMIVPDDSANLHISREDSFLSGLYSEKGRLGQTLLKKMRQHKNASILLRADKVPPSSVS